MQTPDTPISQQAASDMQRSIGAHGSDMEKFFGGMMANGGQQNLDQILGDMDANFATQQQNMINQMKASGIPGNSSAMGRLMGEQLGQANIQHNLARGQTQLNEMNNVFNRQFQGAQGLGYMPQYYAQPSSIEAAMFGMRQPYDLGRMQSLGNAYNNLFAQNYYQPERIEGPSPFEQYVVPIVDYMQGNSEMAMRMIMQMMMGGM